jgi:hypothetical protein
VNRNVTTPEGAAADAADTPAESHTDPLPPRTSPESASDTDAPRQDVARSGGRIAAALDAERLREIMTDQVNAYAARRPISL